MQNLGQDRRQSHAARNTIFVRKCETAHHDDSSTNRHEMHRSRHTTCHKREWSYALNNSHKANSLFITFRPLPLSRQLGGSVSSVHVLSQNGSQFEKTIYFHFDCNWQWPADCFSLFIILFCCHDLSLAWLTYQRFVDCANGQTKFTADSIRIRQRRSKELWHMVQVPFISAIYLNHLIFTRRVRKIDWSKEIRHSTVNTFHRLIVERTHSNEWVDDRKWLKLAPTTSNSLPVSLRGHARRKRGGGSRCPATNSKLNYQMHSRFKSTKYVCNSKLLAN